MVINILALSNLASFKDKVNMNIRVEVCMRESLTKIRKKAKEDIYGEMEEFMKVNIKMIKKMGKVK